MRFFRIGRVRGDYETFKTSCLENPNLENS